MIGIHQAIKTERSIYLITDYANMLSLAELMRARGQRGLSQVEARLVIKQVIQGVIHLQRWHKLSHLTPLDILLHLPENAAQSSLTLAEKQEMLHVLNLTDTQFQVKIKTTGSESIIS